MFKIPKNIIEEKKKFKESLEKFLSGEMKETFFRGIRVPWGNYSQRGGKALMSRLRVPAGILSPAQLKAIGEAAKKFGGGGLHLTTRQDIQIHDVEHKNCVKIVEYLEPFEISPRGGGGNTVRNITANDLSGVCLDERIEAYRYAWGLSEYLLSLEEAYNLPRKFKISFSGCDKDRTFIALNDLGFIANNGGFKVLCGGGMGAKSAVGKVLEEKADPADAGYITKAVVNVYSKFGDRKNKHRNRLRFLIEDIGWDKFVELYKRELKRIKEEEHISLKLHNGLPELCAADIVEENDTASSAEYEQFLKYNTGGQKQPGYHYAQIRVPFGEITADQIIGLSRVSELVPEATIRTTQRQNLIITNIARDKLLKVYEEIRSLFKNFLFPETILDTASCKAATTCNLGICNAMSLAPEVEKEVIRSNIDIEKFKDVRININGCPNACGHHPLGTISLSGLARKVNNRNVPFYKIYLGAKSDSENTRLAKEAGIAPARAVPAVISEFVKAVDKLTDKDVGEYIASKGAPIMEKIIKKYSYVPRYDEDRSYYTDFGKTSDFSFEGLSQGECGAGVIDMIESDIQSARQSLAKAKDADFDISQIRASLVFSARALLVLKGIDPVDEKDIIENFLSQFVKGGICDARFLDLGTKYDSTLRKSLPKEDAYRYAADFLDEIKNIYSSIDSNFNFKTKTKKEAEKTIQKSAAPVYDLRGVACPINYVKVKLKLEGMNIGDVLEIYLDAGEPVDNVPKSLLNDGQEVLSIESVENYFKVIAKKLI